MRDVVLVALLLCSALALFLALTVQQFMLTPMTPLFKVDFEIGSNTVYASVVEPQEPGSGGGGDGLI